MNDNSDLLKALGAIGATSTPDLEKPGKQALQDALDVIKILKEYNSDMQASEKYAGAHNHKTPNLDRWYHRAAMYDATKGKPWRGVVALGAGSLKEVLDFGKYLYKTWNPIYSFNEGVKDMGRNLIGVSASLLNPNLPVEQNNYLNNLRTPTMRAMMPSYREQKNEKNK